MAELAKHRAVGTCYCLRCQLVYCGALPDDWSAWYEIAYVVDARVLMYLLVQWEPVVWPDAHRRWAGCVDWFRCMGLGLEFAEDA